MIQRRMISLLFCAVVAFAAQETQASVKSGKIIQWGDAPPATYMKDHIRELERLPFDGIVMGLLPNAGSRGFGWDVWGPTALREEDYSQSIEALKSIRFERFTDNFLTLNVAPGYIDWFDKDFSSVIANAGLLARITKECGIKGIVLDVEQYYGAPFSYQAQKGWKEHSFEDYQAQVRQRGREFIKAINAERPDATILMTFGHEIAYSTMSEAGNTLDKSPNGLLPSFIDGMLDAAAAKTRIYNGFEYAYGYRQEKQFLDARDTMLKQGLERTAADNKSFRKHFGASFGLWTDNERHWDPKDFRKNYFTPEEFEYSIHMALKYTDRYVWVYSEKARWWDWEKLNNVPQQYIDAVANARKPHLNPPPVRLAVAEKKKTEFLSAKTLEGADDASTFGDLWNSYDEIISLPKDGWKFKLDPKDEGDKQQWFAEATGDSDWQGIQIAEFWETQGHVYDGTAWYRRWIDIPASAANRELRLVFGAVDESAWLYINGQQVGEHDKSIYGWMERFEFDVTKFIKPGQKNLVVVKVVDRAQYGGIWKSVKLVAAK